MQPSIIYNVFIRDFRKQRKRITLTLIALGWGTISIMLLLGFGEGLHKQLSKNQKGMGENIVVLWGNQTSKPYKGLGRGRRIRFEAKDIQYLRNSIPELKEVGGEYSNWGVEVKYKNTIVSEHVTGITPNYETMRNHIPQPGGRMINDLDIKLKRRVVFLGPDLKTRLMGDEDAIGKMIYISGIPFQVVGVMQDKMQMGSYGGMDISKASIPLNVFKAIFGYHYLNNIVYQVADPDDNKRIEKKVFKVFGAKYRFDPEDNQALWVWDTVASSKEFNNMLMGIKMFLGIIGGLTLLIAGVGVANIMYVSVKERTREIGVKMATGARKFHILTQFLIEAFIITFLGGFGGMSISYVLTEAFKRIPIESDALTFMGRPTISLEIGIIVIIILGLMGLLSGFFPALRAASVNPVDSLRYE